MLEPRWALRRPVTILRGIQRLRVHRGRRDVRVYALNRADDSALTLVGAFNTTAVGDGSVALSPMESRCAETRFIEELRAVEGGRLREGLCDP